ncbi:hypothetical protein AT727_02305 [Desulfitobacterium hafniense]|uniref:Uncharacterized protein n=1 Tax=Desulfitobacterium hafniense TaxID=49338 RepID=A0A0W1JRC1_DESHA|nr:hypothetical protein [Desulfitobacterium hafniense]KTE93807.1 hypothetical protein AT727_02305 [Desulfitobacterium hafniense]
MRKMYLLIGSVALGVGLVIGVVGHALATTPADGNPRLAFWNKDSQSTTGAIGGMLNDSTSGSALSPNNPDNGLNPLHPYSPEEEVLDPAELEPGKATNNVPEDLAQAILTDYKLNVATLFEAWKSPDMTAFRAKLAEAYTGELFEKHARQAEPFIAQGVGMEVSSIRFDELKVDSAASTSATLTAVYSYVAQDYDIGNQMTLGESTKHQVKVRANLVKKDTRWLITGETLLEP